MIPSRRGDCDEDDGRLVRRAKAGQASAFDTLVERHTARLFGVVVRFVNDRQEAEAVVQEAWLRAWKSLARCDESRPLFPWLSRIAINVSRDIWRRKRPLDFTDVGEAEVITLPDATPGPEQRLEERQLLERLAEGVAGLRPEHRAVIALRYDGGMSYEEIAQALRIPVNTVRTYLHRAKAALRRWMEAQDERSDG